MSSGLETRPKQAKRPADIDAGFAAGFYRDGYTWGRFGLPEATWFPGVGVANYPVAWRDGWARGHADWQSSRECHVCGEVIETTHAAASHQRSAHPWTQSGKEVIDMTTTPDEHDHDQENAPGPGQPDPEPTVDPSVGNPVTPQGATEAQAHAEEDEADKADKPPEKSE